MKQSGLKAAKKKLLEMTRGRWLHQKMAGRFLRWKAWARKQRSVKKQMVKTISFILHRALATAVTTWKRRIAADKHKKQVMGVFVKRMKHKVAFQCFVAWFTFSVRQRRRAISARI